MNRSRRRRIPLLMVLASVAFTLALSAALAAHVPGVGDVAPSFLGRTLDGHTISLGSYSGKVVVISFWATWCPPCRAELPILDNIQKAGKGYIQVIAINTESRDVFRRAAKILAGYQLLLTNDVDNRGFKSYGGVGLPHLVVIGKDGRIVSVRSGYGSGEIPDLADELNRALAGPPEPAPAAPAEQR
jgi:thiol-disulfide isomerase/thioredoxin